MSDNQLFRELDMLFGWLRPIQNFFKRRTKQFARLVRKHERRLGYSSLGIVVLLMACAFVAGLITGFFKRIAYACVRMFKSRKAGIKL